MSNLNPLWQLQVMFSCRVPGYLGEEANPHLATTSAQGVLEHDKVPPEPPQSSQIPCTERAAPSHFPDKLHCFEISPTICLPLAEFQVEIFSLKK